MLKIKQFCFGPFGVNTYIVYDPDTLDAIVVDPGMSSAAEQRRFDTFISDEHLKINQIVNTHLHLDHCFGDNYVRDRYGVKVAANVGDAFLGDDFAGQLREFGIHTDDAKPVEIDVNLKEGDFVQVGNYKLAVLEVPGHSPGGIALYSRDGNFAIVGDSLFRGSIGRTDLPGGNYRQLIDSVGQKLFSLPEGTLVLTGHDMSTSVGTEKRTNPFFH